jgi:hypothetical protein
MLEHDPDAILALEGDESPAALTKVGAALVVAAHCAACCRIPWFVKDFLGLVNAGRGG